LKSATEAVIEGRFSIGVNEWDETGRAMVEVLRNAKPKGM